MTVECVDMELEFDKYCVVDGSPTTVLPSVCRSNNMLSDNGDFTELMLNSCLGVSYKDTRSQRFNQKDIKMMKRSSAYQSSEEVMQLKGSDAAPERKKIEYSGGSEAMLSFGIIESLCNLDEDNSPVDQARLSVMSGSEQSTSSFWSEQTDIFSPGFVSYPVHPLSGGIGKQKITSSDEDEQSTDHQSLRNPATNFHKSLSAKLALPQSPVQYKSDGSKFSSPDFHISPGRKSFDSFVKSKIRKSPLNRVCGTVSETINGCAGSETLHKVMLGVSLDKQLHMGYNSQCSPEHLHGLLQLITKRGIPCFKFSVKSPEEIYFAKTWKVDNTLNWIYTFHLVKLRRNSSAVGWKFKDSKTNSSMVGQMLVSCYLSTELKVSVASSDFMITEFVVYDINHLRKNGSSQDDSNCSPDACKAHLASDETTLSWSNSEQNKTSTKAKNKVQVKHSSDCGQSESLDSQPLAAERLHPGLEVAAIIIQVPFDRRESLKFKSGDMKNNPLRPKLIDLYQLEQVDEAISDGRSLGKVQVVIPSEHHSLPSSGNHGPLPLLKRWRLGGGCDCGGWDVGCPLTVFNNLNFQVAGDHSLIDNQHPAELFHEGRKDSIPAFNMRAVGEGKYEVDFHTQLSSLQAFSICVALLHAASSAVGPNKHRKLLQPNPFAEKKVERFRNAIVEEQMPNPNNMMEKMMPSFVINPPFSPIARV